MTVINIVEVGASARMRQKNRGVVQKYYRCKQQDEKLYAVLLEKIQHFITMDKLLEMAHGLVDTNMNETFNNICTWFAPKNMVYAGVGYNT